MSLAGRLMSKRGMGKVSFCDLQDKSGRIQLYSRRIWSSWDRFSMTYLKTVREKEVADLIKEARSFGDLSENSEYDEAPGRTAAVPPAGGGAPTAPERPLPARGAPPERTGPPPPAPPPAERARRTPGAARGPAPRPPGGRR